MQGEEQQQNKAHRAAFSKSKSRRNAREEYREKKKAGLLDPTIAAAKRRNPKVITFPPSVYFSLLGNDVIYTC